MMKHNLFNLHLCALLLSVFSINALAASHMASDRISDIRNTKHNFASSDIVTLPNGTTRKVVSSENQVCIFCHTPHGDPVKTDGVGNAKPFLWNRSDSATNLTNADKYTSSSLNINNADVALGDKSKMCLSCHDGTVAIGQLDMNSTSNSVEGGSVIGTTSASITVTGDNVNGGMLIGNANLGTDFKNDHPIGFSYNSALAASDNELIDPTSAEGDHIGVRASRKVTNFNQTLAAAGTAGTAAANNPTSAITRISVPLEADVSIPGGSQTTFVSVASSGKVECTTCHDPHIRSTNVDENIKFLRLHRFQKTDPTDTAFDINKDINCLACHKKTGWVGSAHATEAVAPHIFTSAEAEAREIPENTAVWQASCLACHDTHTVDDARWLLRQSGDATLNSEVSDVDNSCYECHSSTGVLDSANNAVADIESIALTGGHAAFTFTLSDTAHRPINADLTETQADLQVRHAVCSDCHNPHRLQKGLHEITGLETDNNVSGALTGVAGLDASDSSGTFDPYAAEDTSTPNIATKEYQVCFKCHSSYGHSAANIGSGAGQFSNTVMEFSNTTSAHPVVTGTGNVNLDENLMIAPFNTKVAGVSGVGQQTMYCSDCHTNTDGSGLPVDPMGSHNNNIAACETCHVADQYLTAGTTPINSAFACAAGDCVTAASAGQNDNLHIFHASAIGNENVCSNCHVKIPHGWRRRGLLADTSDGTTIDAGTGMEAQYYPAAIIDINDILPLSGTWKKTDCTSAGCH